MIPKTGHYGAVLLTVCEDMKGRSMITISSRAFIENGIWQGSLTACDAIVQRQATLRVSALAGLVTLALLAGPELRLPQSDAQQTRLPLISQPEMVSAKPIDRVPDHAPAIDEVTSSAPARPQSRLDAEMVESASPALQSHQPIEILDPTLLRAGDMQVRLAGISIPQGGKACRRLDGLTVSCSDRAASYLQLLVKGRSVACDKAGIAKDGMTMGHCRIGEIDIAEQMLRQGWAQIEGKAQKRLVLAEAAARKQNLGIWQE